MKTDDSIVYKKFNNDADFIWCGKQYIDLDLINSALKKAVEEEKITIDEYEEYLKDIDRFCVSLQDFFIHCIYPLKLLDMEANDEE